MVIHDNNNLLLPMQTVVTTVAGLALCGVSGWSGEGWTRLLGETSTASASAVCLYIHACRQARIQVFLKHHKRTFKSYMSLREIEKRTTSLQGTKCLVPIRRFHCTLFPWVSFVPSGITDSCPFNRIPIGQPNLMST